jgi:hypothetical protein
MIEEEWLPNEEDIEWTTAHLESMQIGGVWAPGGAGTEYERTGEREMSLLRIVQHPDAGEMHRRILMTLERTDWSVVEENAEMVLPPLNPQEAQFQQLLRQQEIAAEWDCQNPECEQKLVNMPLEDGVWTSHGMQAALDEEGQGIEMERWTVGVMCHECGTPIHLDPQDYGLLGGDELFFRWVTLDGVYTVLTREQVVEMVDSGVSDDVCHALGSQSCERLHNEDGPIPVPPHMRGTYCMFAPSLGEEE